MTLDTCATDVGQNGIRLLQLGWARQVMVHIKSHYAHVSPWVYFESFTHILNRKVNKQHTCVITDITDFTKIVHIRDRISLRMRHTCLHWNFSLPFYAFFPQDKGSPCNLVMDTEHGKRWRTQPGKNCIKTLCNSIDIDYFPSVPFWKV